MRYLYAMIRILFFAITTLLLGISCQDKPSSSEKMVTPDTDPNSPAAMVSIPLDASGNPDKSKLASISFDNNVHLFGTVKEGEIVEHTFTFTNNGKVALIIYDALSSCGCTVPEFPKEPISPGDSGKLLVRFNTENKTGQQVKSVTVQANTFPTETKLSLAGEVTPK